MLARTALAWLVIASLLTAPGCSRGNDQTAQAPPESSPTTTDSSNDNVVLSIVGTNDLHGALDRLPILAGFVKNLRATRKSDGGAVLLIDGGDMFQGTIESNSNEGAAVIDAYNAIGYTAATIGNHEFDFGPTGKAVVAASPDDDPRGALKERIRQARFPLLTANILDRKSGQRVNWSNAAASFIHEAAGVKVGIIGVTTESTLRVTMAANVSDLAMAPLTETIAREAQSLRQQGAAVVIVTAHAGGRCKKFDKPDDLSSCDLDEEIVHVAKALPKGSVDAIVGGHTHQAMAHRVNGIAIIESYSRGRAFGRVDLKVSRKSNQVTDMEIFAPRSLCAGKKRVAASECQPGSYEGQPVTPDPTVTKAIAAAMEQADKIRKAPLNVQIDEQIKRSYLQENALGNLIADLMLEAKPADVAITNAGGIRANLPAGLLTYGALYEVVPFDNRFARAEMTGAQLARLLSMNLQKNDGIFLLSGATVRASCNGATLEVDLFRNNGRPIKPKETVTVTTSDFLATMSGGPFVKLGLPQGAIVIDDGPAIRDSVADVLRKRGGNMSGSDSSLYNPSSPRVEYPPPRPVRCRAK